MELLLSIIIEDYPRKIQVSKSRRIKYYELGKKKIPNKYTDNNKYYYKNWGSKNYLTDKSTNERIIANPRSAGTPKLLIISGQKIYNGQIQEHSRAKIVNYLKEEFIKVIKDISPIALESFPIRIKGELHDLIYDPLTDNEIWDMDNRKLLYCKVFQDALKDAGIIPDDNIFYITESPTLTFCPIEDEKYRKLIFNIYSDDRPEIKENKFYKSEYSYRKALQNPVLTYEPKKSEEREDM